MSTSHRPIKQTACITCGKLAWQSHFAGLQRCGNCGFVRADMKMTDEQLRELYSEKYFHGGEYGDYLAECDAHRRNALDRFRQFTRITGQLESMFELGCSNGFWLECLSLQGIRCAGIDLCETATDYARKQLGQQAVAGNFLELALEEGQYGAYCMWDTIEHLAEPERFVARIFSLLPRGGWFFATTGDIGSRMARWRGPRWRMIHPPTHLQYFSADTMRRFLTRTGFHVRHLSAVPYYRNLRSILANVQVLSTKKMQLLARVLAGLIPAPIQKHLGFALNLGDIMLVCAQKP